MAFDKKTSMYSDHGAYGSAEELDAYGVWVKSEPQDLASSLADAVGVGFGEGPMPFEEDYDTGYDSMGVGGVDLSDIDGEAPHLGLGMGDFTFTSYEDEAEVEEEQGIQDGVSNQILAKIADELSSIRLELTTIKNEFTEIRMESGRNEAERDGSDGGFFSEGDDEKIALTGDEMDTILTSPDFSGEEEFAFDSGREADAVRLRKISEQNEASEVSAAGDESQDGEEEEEVIDIDLDNLGIDLDAEIEKLEMEAQAETPEANELARQDEQDEAFQLAEDISSFDTLGEIDEMRNLHLEGVEHLSPIPDDASFLEEYSFTEESAPDLGFGDAPFDLDFPGESALGLDDELAGENQFAPLDLSDVVIDEPNLSAGLDEPELDVPEFDGLSLEDSVLDDISLDAKEFETSIDLGIQDDSLAQIIPEGFELEQQEEAAAPFDDDFEIIVENDAEIAAQPESPGKGKAPSGKTSDISPDLKSELKDVLSYMDHLLESLPEEKIEEFAKSEHFDTYQKIFKELGLA